MTGAGARCQESTQSKRIYIDEIVSMNYGECLKRSAIITCPTTPFPHFEP